MKSFRFINKAREAPALYFFGDIVSESADKFSDEDACPSEVVEALRSLNGEDIDIYINSGGGSVFAGLAIYNLLRSYKGKKRVHVVGLAGSIASVIALSGDEIHIPANAYMMIHKPYSLALGNASELRKTAEDLDKIEEGIIVVYNERLKEGVDIEKVKEMVAAETWLDGKMAGEYFDIIVEPKISAVSFVGDALSKCTNLPKGIEIKGQNFLENEEKGELLGELDGIEAFLFLEKK